MAFWPSATANGQRQMPLAQFQMIYKTVHIHTLYITLP